MNLAQVKAQLGVAFFNVTEDVDQDSGKATGWASQFDTLTRVGVAFSPEAYAAVGTDTNDFAIISRERLSKDKTVVDEETGTSTVVEGSAYVQHTIVIREGVKTF